MLELFTTNHLIWLGVTAALVAVLFALSFLFRKNMNALLTVGFALLLVLDLVKMAYNVSYSDDSAAAWQKGFYVGAHSLPFHLCSIQVLLLLIARCSKPGSSARKLLLPVISVCATLGGIMAALIPVEGVAFVGDTLLHTVMPYRYFASHAVLIAVGLALAFHPETGWTGKSYFGTVGFLFLLFVASLYVNGMFHTNFMYTAYPPAENLPFLEVKEGDVFSWYWYLVKLVFCALALVTLYYIPVWIVLTVNGIKSEKRCANPVVTTAEGARAAWTEEESEEDYDEEYDEASSPITIASILEGEYTEEEKRFIESGVLPESEAFCPVEELSDAEKESPSKEESVCAENTAIPAERDCSDGE